MKLANAHGKRLEHILDFVVGQRCFNVASLQYVVDFFGRVHGSTNNNYNNHEIACIKIMHDVTMNEDDFYMK